jgi:S-adenosylmethionine/arginine decarboxylase-like enzyme
MKNGFGRHFIADLYFCQNELWQSPGQFLDEIHRVTRSLNITNDSWSFSEIVSDRILISGEIDDSFVLIQVFPDKHFLAVDIFCWQSQINIQHFSEGLVAIFGSQVIAAETRLRAEHLN